MKRISIYIILLIVFAFNISKANIEIDTSIPPIFLEKQIIDVETKKPVDSVSIIINESIYCLTDSNGFF